MEKNKTQKGAWRFAGQLKDVFAPEGNMLNIGDTIKCSSKDECIKLHNELARENIKTDFLYEKDGEKGLWLEVKCNKSVMDNYTCEGQMDISDFPEVMP